jgi:hypothetical protein
MPSLARFLGREVGPLDVAIFVALTSSAATWCFFGPARSAAAAALLLLTAAQLAVLACALGALLRLVTRRRLRAGAYSLAQALIVAYLALDRLAFGILHAHPDWQIVRETWRAFRAGALEPGGAGIARAGAALVLLWAALTLVLKVFALLPRRPAADRWVRRSALPALLATAAASTLRPCAVHGVGASGATGGVPWDVQPAIALDPVDGGRVGSLLGDERVFALLAARSAEALAAPPRARSTPDILILHVESLRYDMLRPDIAPTMSALARQAIVPAHHFTTGTNTGTGVFGILTGLLSPYYPLARRDHTQPLPLRVLKALGYRVSVYFANNFRIYDGLYDLFFAGLADGAYDGPSSPVHAADAAMVGAYVASLRSPPGGPRFDYVVLDSTHYDYSYPPEFERFTPAMTLDLGIRDGLIIRPGINDELSPRAPFIRNRYQNSVLYADSLVETILAALRDTKRLERTIVVVTGDHGEEFWEHGVFGHGYGHLSREQCEVPLLLRLPSGPNEEQGPARSKSSDPNENEGPARSKSSDPNTDEGPARSKSSDPKENEALRTTRYRYSTHADIFPTIFDFMGVETDGGPTMNGKSLLRYEPSLDLAVSGFGVTGDKTDPRLVAVGDGLTVHWVNTPPFTVTEVTADDSSPLERVPQERADDLVVRALAYKGLR